MSDGVGRIPQGWEVARISELCQINPKHDRGLDDKLEVSFVPMAAVSDLLGAITEPEIRMLGKVRKGYTHFADGDVIFAKITPCMENGKAASVRHLRNGLACGTTEFFVLRQHGALEQDYLYYFIRQESYRKAARATMQSGVGQARVPKEFIEETELPVPPLNEQRRIVAKIVALQERSRKAREALSEVRPLLEQFRQSLLTAAYRGDLTADWRAENPDVEPASQLLARIRQERRERWEQAELAKYEAKGKRPPKGWKEKYQEPEPVDDSELPELPEGWCWARFDEVISELRNGVSPKPQETAPGTPILRINSVRPLQVNLGESRYLADADPFLPAFLLRDRDLLFTRYNGSIDLLGVCGMVRELGGEQLLYPDKLMRVRLAHEELLPEYVEIYFSSPFARSGITQKAKTTSGQQGVSGSDIKGQPIIIMPAKEQAEIVRLVTSAFQINDSQQDYAVEVESSLTDLDQSILAKAFRGELVPQDPSDEPASVLLDRIREQRDAAGNKSKKPTRRKRKQPEGQSS